MLRAATSQVSRLASYLPCAQSKRNLPPLPRRTIRMSDQKGMVHLMLSASAQAAKEPAWRSLGYLGLLSGHHSRPAYLGSPCFLTSSIRICVCLQPPHSSFACIVNIFSGKLRLIFLSADLKKKKKLSFWVESLPQRCGLSFCCLLK